MDGMGISNFAKNWWTYCWWKKSQTTTWDLENPVKNGISTTNLNIGEFAEYLFTINSISTCNQSVSSRRPPDPRGVTSLRGAFANGFGGGISVGNMFQQSGGFLNIQDCFIEGGSGGAMYPGVENWRRFFFVITARLNGNYDISTTPRKTDIGTLEMVGPLEKGQHAH